MRKISDENENSFCDCGNIVLIYRCENSIIEQTFTVSIAEVHLMGASYKKLWKLLIDHDMKKRDLAQLAKVSPTTIAKLGKGESVNLEILLRICQALECDISDIMEVLLDEKAN